MILILVLSVCVRLTAGENVHEVGSRHVNDALSPLDAPFGPLDRQNTPQDYEKECSGTSMGFSYSGSLRRHYRYMRRRYTGCTYVRGNLEITHLRQRNIDYNLDFLRSIRYVSGYVLIALVTEVSEIPLVNLEVIRGNQTIEIFGREFSLAVTLTSRQPGSRLGLRELQLTSLREISDGNVFFAENPGLCYMRSVRWETLLPDGREPMLKGNHPIATRCMPCSRSCDVGGVRSCWGRGKTMCQRGIEELPCHPSCPHRCFGPGRQGCCHKQCAAGCWDGSPANCEICKNYSYDGRCVGWCPIGHNTYPEGQACKELRPLTSEL